jgi:RNA polymerase sigma-70 factor, ECF subfamily
VPDRAAEELGIDHGSPRLVKSPQLKRPSRSELVPLDDEELMKEVQAQNGDALAVLFDRYYTRVLNVALKILHDRAEAEDILQIIFLEIYQKAGHFDPSRGRFYAWLMQMAFCRSYSRRNYLIVRQFYGNVPVDELTDFDHGFHKLYSQPPHECRRFVQQALALLTEAQKRTIEMFYLEGLTLKEIAEKNDETYSSVRHHYYRGLARLRTCLKSARHKADKQMRKAGDLEVTSAEA